MKKILLLILLVAFGAPLKAQITLMNSRARLNGYVQFRSESNFTDHFGFLLRRLKLWIRSDPGFSTHWSYKIQTTFSGLHQEKFFLQDVKIGYRQGAFSFDIGQFVPQFSLQRFQHDYQLPVLERANVINTLIPDGTLGVRDIGLQVNYAGFGKKLKTHLGLFNGYGIKFYRANNRGYLLTHKTSLRFHPQRNTVEFGYSLQFRKADRLPLKGIFPDSVLYSGEDFRYDIFFLFRRKYFALQGEYLRADFGGHQAYGFYLLSTTTIRKNQFSLSYEMYQDLIKQTKDDTLVRFDYHYLWQNYKTRFSLDISCPPTVHWKTNCSTSLQVQLFLS